MSEIKHTPGPWVVGKPSIWHGHGFLPVGRPVTPDGRIAYVVASIHPENDAKGQVQWSKRDLANANLIAAAPDMLAALHQMVTWMPSGFAPQSKDNAMKMAYDAIRKAEGRDTPAPTSR